MEGKSGRKKSALYLEIATEMRGSGRQILGKRDKERRIERTRRE